MKFTNGNAFQNMITLQQMSEQGVLGYAIAKNRRKLENELKEYLEKREELFEKYGQREGDQWRIGPDDVPAFLKEMGEYDAVEFEFDPTTVTEEAFCAGTLTSDQMYQLDWMVREE